MNYGTMTLNKSEVNGNTAGGAGGGIANAIPLPGPMPLIGGALTLNHSQVTGNYSLPHNAPPSLSRQSEWRSCNKCQGLFYGPAATTSTCQPAAPTHHGFVNLIHAPLTRDTPHNFTATEQQAARYLLINTPGSPTKSRRRSQRRTSKYARAMA